MTELAELNWFSNKAATFGDRVAAARDAQGLTQSALSRKLGIASKTLDGWEHDMSEPRANKLQMLSGVLNVSIPWLLMGEGPGLDEALPDQPDSDISDLMVEMRVLRTQISQAADRMGVLEKRLKSAMVDTAV